MSTRMTPASPPSHRKIVFLRGINVGRSARIAMADLRACTKAAGCTDVTTVLASGNVTVTDPRPIAELRAVLEAAYADRFGYDAVVQVLHLADVVEAVESYPFATLEDHHDYVVFSDDPDVATRVEEAMGAAVAAAHTRADSDVAADADPGTEAVAGGPGCVYWRVPRGSTLASDAATVLDARENKRHLTTRNMNTLRRILAAG